MSNAKKQRKTKEWERLWPVLEKAVAPHCSTRAWKIPWMEVCDSAQEAVIKTIPKKKKCKKAKWLSEEALQIAVKRREAKAKEKRKAISI